MGQIIIKARALDWTEGNVGHVHVLLDGGTCKVDWGDGHTSGMAARGLEWVTSDHVYPEGSRKSGDRFYIVISSCSENITGILASRGEMQVEDIDISRCLYLIDMNGLPLSCSRYDGTSVGMLKAISSMRKDLMVGSLVVIPPSSLSSEDSLALIADEGYGFIAGGSWLRDIGTGPYTCKARIHLQDGEIRRTGRAGAPRRYRISSVPSMVFDSGYPLITDIPGIGKEEAFRIYGMKEQLEEDAASISTDSLPLMFACLTAMRYIQYRMGRRIPVRDAIEGAEAIILGTEDQRFYGICATDLYLKASRALGMPALRKTMTQSMMDAYMEAGDA